MVGHALLHGMRSRVADRFSNPIPAVMLQTSVSGCQSGQVMVRNIKIFDYRS
jgi:hypothetical protein